MISPLLFINQNSFVTFTSIAHHSSSTKVTFVGEPTTTTTESKTTNKNQNDDHNIERPPQRIISPADLAKRLANSGSKNHHSHYQHHQPPSSDVENEGGDQHHQQLTPRKGQSASATGPVTGVKREALRLYRSLLKATKAPKPSSNVDNAPTTKEKEAKVERIRLQPKKQRDEESGAFRVKAFEFNAEQNYVRQQFREHQKIPRKHIDKIQWHIHHGQMKLEELEKLKKFRTGFKVMTFG